MKKRMTEILYTSAKDIHDQIILATNAEKGKEYFCPQCGTEMILKKSGNTGKRAKRPHFAHKTLTKNCTAESVLHYSFKYLLAKYINESIKSKTPIIFHWHCHYCGSQHQGNLIKKAQTAKIEFNLSICQPDIALLDQKGNIFAVIEIVVSHAPEEKTLKFYKNNNIILIQINIRNDQELNFVEEKISRPDLVDFCLNKKCPICANPMKNIRLTIIEGDCYRCKNKMNIAAINKGNEEHIPPSEFSPEEVAIARSKGVFLKVHYSRTLDEEYLANTCPNCRAFCGDFFLFTQYIAPAYYGEYPLQDFEIGYYCEYCDKSFFQY